MNIIAKKRPPPMNIGYSFEGIEPTRKVLYRNFHMIGEQVYLVEISRNRMKVFILLFPNFERPDQYISEIMTDKQATRMLNENDNIFENFISKFYIKFNKLQIKGFHGKAPVERAPRTVDPRRAWELQHHRNPLTEMREGYPRDDYQTSHVVRSHVY